MCVHDPKGSTVNYRTNPTLMVFHLSFHFILLNRNRDVLYGLSKDFYPEGVIWCI